MALSLCCPQGLPSGTATRTADATCTGCSEAELAGGKGGEESPDEELAFPDSVNGVVCTILSVSLGTKSINQAEPDGTDF